MFKSIKKVSQSLVGPRFLAAAALLAMGCNAEVSDDPSGEEVGEVSQNIVTTRRVRIHVYKVDTGFDPAMMTPLINHANSVFLPAGIQFDFDPATDVSENPNLPAGICKGSLAAMDAVGDALVGKIATFYCPTRGGGEASFTHNRFAFSGDAMNFTHELAHYFQMPHVFRENWMPEDDDLVGKDATWHSVERCVRDMLEGTRTDTACPTGFTSATALRDYLLDGDGFTDTAISVHETVGIADGCAANLTVPLIVHRSNGTTLNLSFSPLRTNPAGYFFCSNIPWSFSPQQIDTIYRSVLTGVRSHLINKPLKTYDTSFSDANGWTNAKYYSTLKTVDVSADGKADLCGRGGAGIMCGTSTGTKFNAPTNWNSSFSDANGWGAVQYYSTLRYPNVNGTGGADVCGRGSGGVSCATSTGSSFGAASVWQSAFSDANGWNAEKYYATLDFPEVSGDTKADVCGRGSGGINCAISNGTAFGAASVWQSAFSDANGWGAAQYYRTIRYPNVNGTGGSDVCGRGVSGITCATSTGTAFGAASTWAPSFSDANGWNAAKYYSTIAYPDLNKDGKKDVCGRGGTGIFCGLSSGTSFGAVTQWIPAFSDADGWDQELYYSTLTFVDIDNDQRADVCGRGTDGVYCAYSSGTEFVNFHKYSTSPSNTNGWNAAQYAKTLMFANIDSDSPLELCGRGISGMLCE